MELYRDINESRQELNDEQTHVRRAFGREKEQRSTLDNLGLDEVEAVEYVLMLSRDEEEARSRGSPSTPPNSHLSLEEEGVFEGDFDDIPRDGVRIPSSARSSPSSTYQSQPGRSLPRTSPSASNHKIQVSPRFRAEATEAGFSVSPLKMSTIASSSNEIARSVSSSSLDDFPSISPTPSTSSPSPPTTSSVRRTSPDTTRAGVWGSLRPSVSSSGPASPQASSPQTSRRGSAWITNSTVTADRQPSTSSDPPSLLSAQPVVNEPATVEDLDDDLKYAIELSLAEARSRA